MRLLKLNGMQIKVINPVGFVMEDFLKE